MGTQSQKYNGNNTYNNYVHIDFTKNKVEFKPIKGKMNGLSNYMSCAISMQQLLGYVILLIYVIYSLSFTIKEFDRTKFIVFVGFLMLIYFSSRFIFLLFFLNKKVANNFPKINAFLINILSVIKKGKTAITKGHVNKELIRGKEYRISGVENIYFKYKLSGEFAKYIKDIKIMNMFEDNPFLWEIIFYWNKKPKKGKLYIEYI